MGDEKTNNNKIDDKKQEQKTAPIDIRGSYYTNGVRTTFSQYEFLLDFFQYPLRDDGRFDGFRVYVNPVNFKHITNLFVEQLKQYEKHFGEIKLELDTTQKTK